MSAPIGAPATGLEIAVIGMAGRFPGAGDLEAFWRNLRDGVESISTFTDEELAAAGVDPEVMRDPAYVRVGGIVEGIERFDAAFFGYYPREAQIIDPQQRILLECAWEALEDAGYDPLRGERSIGVFAGAGTNHYLAHLQADREIAASIDYYQLHLANYKDYLTTRIAYKLNLTGPCVTVQTACSTSLVAVHAACQSILAGECRMALAGGVTVSVPQRVGYRWVEGGVLSPDGRCRAFDARAGGTVGGEGAGLVVLKRLEDALADGDPVRAVIRGSAVNNDGARKMGFTAPSVEGQAMVIRMAHAAAEVPPDTITYVEAHGTGTTLGDPIEMAALTEAFRAGTDRTGFCAVGSLKTNIGHADVAAGVAGLIKTVLALEHAQLPASLHFDRANPEIDLENGPFRVNERTRPWTADGHPRRAGVSSFGLGGTNAHVVLEEAPAPPPAGGVPGWRLLGISAKTRTALEAATDRLADHLERHPGLGMDDVAYTLEVGRHPFAHRRAVLCGDSEDAVRALRTRAPRQVSTGAHEGGSRPVVFMFHGQGAQYVGMGAGLYRTEPVFREQVDLCAELLRPHLGLDLRDVLYPAEGTDGEEAARRLGQTSVTQPATFVVEHALARLWMERGVRPEAMIGHSFGEYTAACLAGVLRLEDALSLVAARGRLVQALPPGAMLAVSLPEAELAPFLDGDVVLAASNAPDRCVAAGPAEAVARAQARLEARDVECRRLLISHAFHCPLVEPVLDSFAAELRRARMEPPRIPYLSNLTGTWIRDEEATDPEYWVRHTRNTVRFSEGVAELLRDPERIFLEVGPGGTFGKLLARHAPGAAGRVVSTLRHARQEEPDDAFLLAAAGKLWTAGAEVRRAPLRAGQVRRRVRLPTYPFERQRFWVDPPRARRTVPEPEPVDAAPAAAPPAPVEPAAPADVAAPGSRSGDEVEGRLLQIWRGLFGIDAPGLEDSFFDLGGDSLLATRLAVQVRRAFAVELPLQAVYQSPTVAELAVAVRAARGAAPGATPATAPSVPDLRAEVVLDPAIVPEPGAPVAAGEADFLLTGATGYLGAYLLHELLRSTPARVHCLVRASTPEEGARRIREQLRAHHLWEPGFAPRIVPVPGDLGAPLLGLSATEFDRLAGAVDAVYHCGARVHFSQPYAALRAANVRGTEEVLRLAARARLTPVHHVSTLAVLAAAAPADGEVREDDPLPATGRLATGYAQSKWVAEGLVSLARARGIPVSVYRAGAVTGHTRTRLSRPDDFLWRMVIGCVQLGSAPETDTLLFGAPVDYVTRALVHLSRQPELLGGTFHLAAPRAARWSGIFAHLRAAGYALDALPFGAWRAALVRAVEAGRENALAQVADLLDDGDATDRREAEIRRVDCRNARQGLAGAGIDAPPFAGELLDGYLAELVRAGHLPAPPHARRAGATAPVLTHGEER
jgi:phthiocerol/phenolphthiocerol synthesis type-I polyketide synthase E